MKKLYLFLLCGLLCTADLNAQTWSIGYPTAANITATLQDSTLTISGTGAMANWSNVSRAPWNAVRTSIHTVIIEDGVTTIGFSAFMDCTVLTSVIIPNSVTTIGNFAFWGCTRLNSITTKRTTPPDVNIDVFARVPKHEIHLNVPAGAENAYRNADVWGDFIIGGAWAIGHPRRSDVIATLQDGTFTVSGTGNMMDWNWSLPDAAVNTPWWSVRNSIRTVIIGDDVTNIGNNAFRDSRNLTSTIIVGNRLTRIGNDAFHSSDLTSIAIPNSVETIGSDAFRDSRNLVSVTIGNSVTSIGSDAFNSCINLAFVIIGNNVTTIGNGAFSNCPSLRTVVNQSLTPQNISGRFSGTTNVGIIELLVPANRIQHYQTAPVWRDFGSIGSLFWYSGAFEENSRLINENNILQKENAALQNQNNILQSEISALQSENNALRDSISALQNNISTCENANNVLQNENSALQSENNRLEDENINLQNQNNNLQITNDDLFETIRLLQQQLADCEEETNIPIIPENQIQVYPNPVAHTLHVVVPSELIGENMVLELYNLSGILVFSKPLNPHTSEFTIDMSQFEQGVYILRIGNHLARIIKL